MSKTIFGRGFRLLSCPGCGAPVEIGHGGGLIRCSYCQRQAQFTAHDDRREVAEIRAAKAMDEAARFQKLREQDGKPLMPPASLQHYLVAGELPPQLEAEALGEWRQCLDEVRGGGSFGSEERGYFLSLILTGYYAARNDDARFRMVAESTVEVVRAPRHRQVLRGMICRRAALVSDPAASSWLELFDPRSDDLHTDSAYRLTVAYLATAQADYGAVFQQLGRRADDVPIADSVEGLATLLRCNALERTGALADATAQLGAYRTSVQDGPRMMAKLQRVHAPLALCAQSMQAQPEASTPAPRSTGRRVLGWIMLIIGIPFLVLGGLALAGTLAATGYLSGEVAFATGLTSGILAATFLPIGLIFSAIGFYAFRAARVRDSLIEHGLDATATIIEAKKTGMLVNDEPMYALRLRIFCADWEPYETTKNQTFPQHEPPTIGASLRLKIDPQNANNYVVL